MIDEKIVVYLGIAKPKGSSGGGSGTGSDDYTELSNKPKINGYTLTGNKTGEDLGLQNKLTSEQLDAVNSGITAEKVVEYDHNLEEFEQLSGEVAALEAEQQIIKNDLGDLGNQVIDNNNAIATKNDIFQLDVFPDLNTPNVPNPFQYTGETIGSAIKGHIYEKVETDFTQWQRTDNQTFVVTMGDALVGDDVYQADGKTVIGTITEISDDAMTYTDTDGQSVSTTYHSVFHTSGFEEVYKLEEDIDLSNYAKKTEVYTRDNADALFIKNAEKGQANGVASLNSMGVIPSEQVNIIDTDVLSEIQLEAVNSGIDNVKVEQIETNKNNIVEIKNTMVTTTTGTKVESMTQAEYDALATKDSKTLYNITDKSSIINDFNEASNDNTFSASLIKNSFLTSQATFTVSSNEDLAKWATNTNGNDYTSVYIAPGTYTLESGSINLTATGTKIVEGHPNAKLVFKSTNVAINTNYYPALYYTTKPDSQEYKMTNVIIDVTGMNATSSNVYATGFYNCINMLNCYATSKSTGTKDWQAAYSYYSCSYLINCQGASSGANNGNAYTFASCSYLTNCIADETVYPATYDNRADIIPYASCNYLINCQAKATNGYELTRGYFGCNYLTGCSATASSSTTTSTEISGFNRCARMVNCQASITNTTGKTLTNIGGFINSTMLDNCVSNDQIYNSSYVFKCNASAYTSSYVDNYSTACADTSTGGYNHIGTLSWSSNKWQ